MSEQNIEIVRQAYENFKSGDIQSLLGLFTDDIDWRVPTIANVPFATGRRSGREEAGGFFATLADSQDVKTFEPREFIAQGERVVALGHYSWRVKSTGQEYEGDWAHVFTIRDGRIAAFQEYTDTAAIAAAYQLKARSV
jgi:ketosteroid isomerase-like protein